MSLEAKILEDMKTAMKARDKVALETLRAVKSKIKYFQVEKKIDSVTEEDVLTVITQQVKQRRDSIAEYEKASRQDLADVEKAELDVLIKYLPQQLTEDELRNLIKNVVTEVGAASKKDMGKVMRELMPKVKGKADGKLVNQIVGEFLPA